MDTVDTAHACLSFRVSDASVRHIHSSWYIAFWKTYQPLYDAFNRGAFSELPLTLPNGETKEAYPKFIVDAIPHFNHQYEFLRWCLLQPKMSDFSNFKLRVSQMNRAQVPQLMELALERHNLTALEVIGEAFGVREQDLMPLLDTAIREGYMDAILVIERICRQSLGSLISDFEHRLVSAARQAAEHGKMEVIKYLCENSIFFANCDAIAESALERGFVDITRWFASQRKWTPQKVGKKFQDCVFMSLCNEHAHGVEFLHKDACWSAQDFIDYEDDNVFLYSVCSEGNLNALRYLHKEVGLTLQHFIDSDLDAITSGGVDIISYFIREMGAQGQALQEAFASACITGRIECAELLALEGDACSSMDLEKWVNTLDRCVRQRLVRPSEQGFVQFAYLVEKLAGLGCPISAFERSLQSWPSINVKLLSALHKIGLTKEQLSDAAWHCFNCRDVECAAYLHETIGLQAVDFRKSLSKVEDVASVEVLSYLHTKVGLEVPDFASICNMVFRVVCSRGDVAVLKFFIETVKVPPETMKCNENDVCVNACERMDLELLKYLKFGLNFTATDFRCRDNSPLEILCRSGALDCVKFLVEELRLSEINDIEDGLRAARNYSRSAVIQYLTQQLRGTAVVECATQCLDGID